MVANRLFLIPSLFFSISLFGMCANDVFRRVRGNSTTVEVALPQLVDSPVASKPQTPSPLDPREIGYFENEFDNENDFFDSKYDQDIIFTCIPPTNIASKQPKLSEADQSTNWRNEPRTRPANRVPGIQRPGSPRKKSTPRPADISTNWRKSEQPPMIAQRPNPRNQSTPITRTSQKAPEKKGYAVWTAPTKKSDPLAVTATAVTLCYRTKKSLNLFDRLPEEKS